MAQAHPEPMTLLKEGDRDHVWASRDGGVPQRWGLIDSGHRRSQPQRTVNKGGLKHSEQEANAFQQLCAQAFACQADAQEALERCEHGLPNPTGHQATIQLTPRDCTRGSPRPGASPQRVDYHSEGALASSWTAPHQLVTQQSCFILATNELDHQALSPPEVFGGEKGQTNAERGFRFLKDPQCLAASLYLKKPERSMALLMVMTVCFLV